MKPVNSFHDVNAALREIENKINSLTLRNPNMHGNRLINAGASKDKADQVIRIELAALKQEMEDKFNTILQELKRRSRA